MGLGFCECGILILIPNGYAKIYGQKNIHLIYGIIALLSVCVKFFNLFIKLFFNLNYFFKIPGSIISSLISPLSNIIGYYVLFCIACSFSAIAWIVAAFFNVKNENGEDI